MDKQEDVEDVLSEGFGMPKAALTPENLEVAIQHMFNYTARAVLRIKHIAEITEKEGADAALKYMQTVPANETVTEDGTKLISSFKELSDSELAEIKKILENIKESPKM